MLRSMFGIGGSEILVILVIALLFLGPDKLPDAAKKISKGIRDIKKQSRVLQQTIENDEHIGGAIRDLKSALRGDELPVRPPKPKAKKPPIAEGKPVTLPPAAGEADPVAGETAGSASTELAAMIRPAADAVPTNGATPVSGAPGSSSQPTSGTAALDEAER